jgi:hypothetical protein
MENFDELFNEFFNEDTKNKEFKKIINALTNYTLGDIGTTSELGVPDEIIETQKDNLLYKKMIWNQPNGQLIKLEVSEIPQKVKKPAKLTLQQQLDKALEVEDYALAIELRDKMKNK